MKTIVQIIAVLLFLSPGLVAEDATPAVAPIDHPVCLVEMPTLDQESPETLMPGAGECPNDPSCEDFSGCVTNVSTCNTVDTGSNPTCEGGPWCPGSETVHVTTCQCQDAPGSTCLKLSTSVRSCQ